MATDVRVLKALLGHFARKVRQQFVCSSLLKQLKRKQKVFDAGDEVFTTSFGGQDELRTE